MVWIIQKKKKEVKDLVPKQKEPPVIVKNPTPEMLISQAIDQQVPIEHMERLMAMRRELKAEQAKEAYFQALSKFQAECPVILKEKSVKNSEKKGGELRYKFAPLDAIISQAAPFLEENGFSYTFKSKQTDIAYTSICISQHKFGHSEITEFTVPIDKEAYMNDPQKVGSARSFANRYSFCNAYGIQTGGEDNDAQSCEDEGPHQEQTQGDTGGIEKVKNQILLEMKADVFTDEERKTKETFMKGIRSIQGLNGMLKGIQREKSDRAEAFKSEQCTDDEREGIQLGTKMKGGIE